MNLDLTKLNALVTGSSRGIGFAIAEALLEAGAKVALHYNRNPEPLEPLLTSFGENARAFQANLEDATACAALFEAARESFGQLDILVNNAGVALHAAINLPLAEWLEAWNRTQAVNLTAAALLCRAAIPHFQEIGGGRIINIASRASFRGDTADYLAYAASKGGMVSLSRSLARAYGKTNIKSFVIAPGFVRTDMAQDFIDQYGEGLVLGDIALNSLTEPKDIAPMVVLLASGLADHATGCSIDINAGSYVH